MEGHEDFVEVAAVLLEGALFEAVLDEAEALIEANRGNIVADDGKKHLLYMRTGGVDDRLNKKA